MGKKGRNQSQRYGETVVIVVGPEEKSFTVHKSILIEHSKFFRDYIQKTHRPPDAISLRGYDNTAFTHIVDFMYNSPAPIEHNDEIPTIIDTYALASELDMETCVNSCVDRLRVFGHDNLIYPDVLLHLKASSIAPSAEIRKCLIDQFAYQLVSEPESGLIRKKDRLNEWMRDLVMTLDRDMLAEVIQKQLVFAKRFKQNDHSWNWFRGQDPSGMYGCRYHVHEHTDCHLVNNERGLVKYRPR